jgi:hypothetical protein
MRFQQQCGGAHEKAGVAWGAPARVRRLVLRLGRSSCRLSGKPSCSVCQSASSAAARIRARSAWRTWSQIDERVSRGLSGSEINDLHADKQAEAHAREQDRIRNRPSESGPLSPSAAEATIAVLAEGALDRRPRVGDPDRRKRDRKDDVRRRCYRNLAQLLQFDEPQTSARGRSPVTRGGSRPRTGSCEVREVQLNRRAGRGRARARRSPGASLPAKWAARRGGGCRAAGDRGQPASGPLLLRSPRRSVLYSRGTRSCPRE